MLAANARTSTVKLRHTTLSIPAEGVWLDGQLAHAPDVRGLALIARAARVPSSHEAVLADALQRAGYATLVADLLTQHEAARDADAPFNIPRLANRLLGIAEWIGHQPALAALPVALIGSATTSAAVIRAAWKNPRRFAAIVCAGGRPDLAGAAPLRGLVTPLRLVVGSEDPDAAIAVQAFERIGAPRDWQRISGSGAWLAEPASLDALARLATEWLERKLPPPHAESSLQRADAEAASVPTDR